MKVIYTPENIKISLNDLSKTIFKKIETYLVENGLDEDKVSSSELKKRIANPPILSSKEFAKEVIYVILAGGFSQKTAKRKFFEITEFIEKYGAQDIQSLLKIFNNKNKINAISKVWINQKNYCDKYYLMKDHEEKVEYLGTLPHIGKITRNHIARNLGINMVKYDVWIQRLGTYLLGSEKDLDLIGFPLNSKIENYAKKVFDDVSDKTNNPIGYIDVILWKACQLNILEFS